MPFSTDQECRMHKEALRLREELEIWRQQIDNLALFMWKHLPQPATFPKKPMELPRGYTFSYWPSREFKLTKMDRDGKTTLFVLEETSKPDYAIAGFAADIADGWFKEMRDLFIEHSTLLETASECLPEQLRVSRPVPH